MSFRDFAHTQAISLAKHVVRMTTTAGSGHPSSALSLSHIVTTLLYDIMRWDPKDPWHPASDRLILSEGHAVPIIYAAYADLGGVVGKSRKEARPLSVADLATLREADSVLDGHPNPAEGFPFFDAATGSLGQGLSVAAGLGAAARLSRMDRQFYVIIGDGESREGQIWEAMDLVADRGMTNVTAIFNCNGQGQADYVSKQQSPEVLAAKSEAFGFKAVILDGHDPDALRAAFTAPRQRPLAVIARTQKGWGCEMLRDKSNHGKPVPAAQVDAAIAQLDQTLASLKVTKTGTDSLALKKPATAHVEPHASSRMEVPASHPELDAIIAKGKMATRRAYGVALLAVAQAEPRVVALDGDVRNSTFSEIMAEKFPDRFVECKIAEQNMVSAAVGMAAAGFIPFVSTFAKFVSRAYDQVEMAQITRANIKIVGSHAGISLGADGPSQMSLHDVAYFRSAAAADNGRAVPVCVSFHPADAVAAYRFTWMMAQHPGMCYMRTHRPDATMLYKADTKFEIGGSHTIATGDAVTVVSSGYTLHVCKQAVDQLASKGIKCALIDAYSFPLNAEPILASAAKTGARILSVEDNYIGGLGSAIAEAAAQHGNIRVESMTVRKLPKSAKTTEAIYEYVGLAPADIAARISRMI